MDKAKKEQIDNIIAAINKTIKRIYIDAAEKGKLMPIADKEGNVIYIDPKTVLNK